jgi:hypothetical protein
MLVVAACSDSAGGGDDTPGSVDPKMIPGGGVADAPIAGVLHVHVVAADSSAIANATVQVGDKTATTSAAGLATFDGITGPQTVTAVAAGHAATTWVGVEGANVTLPLELARALPTARVTGTITGWNALPNPAFGHYTLAVVLYSFLDDPAALENSIEQPMNGTTPLNTCINTGFSTSTCRWQMNTRIGKQIHTAVIVDGDAKGTSNDLSDDTYTLIGYAAGEVVTLTADQMVMDESLAMVTAVQPFEVTFPPAAPGLPFAVAIPELALGDAGRIVFPLPTLTASSRMTRVLQNTGKFAGSYKIVGLATPSSTVTSPFSSVFVDGGTTLPPWLAPPANPMPGKTITFTGAPGAAFHTVRLTRSASPLWNVTLLDGTTSFTLPAITPDPLGTGTVAVAINAADVAGFDAAAFDIPATRTNLARAAGTQATFTR